MITAGSDGDRAPRLISYSRLYFDCVSRLSPLIRHVDFVKIFLSVSDIYICHRRRATTQPRFTPHAIYFDVYTFECPAAAQLITYFTTFC